MKKNKSISRRKEKEGDQRNFRKMKKMKKKNKLISRRKGKEGDQRKLRKMKKK